MEKKYTPGEWLQSHRKGDDGMYNTQVYTPDGETICTLHWYPMPPRDEMIDGVMRSGVIGTYREANARLIAAAPDLLEILMSLSDSLERGYGITLSQRRKAREAISKALAQ